MCQVGVDMRWMLWLSRTQRVVPRLSPFRGAGTGLVWLYVSLFWAVSSATCAGADDSGLWAAPLRVRRWRVDSGLPLSQIPIIAQSRDGYLWLGAPHEGLCRFDGTRFSSPGDELAPPSTFPGVKDPTVLFASSDGSFCVGTRNGLWIKRDREWDHFTTSQGLSSNDITAIHDSPGHDLWVGTADGLNRITGHSIRRFDVNLGLASRPISAVLCDHLGVVWVGTSAGGLYQMRDDRFTIVPRPDGPADDKINAIMEARDGSVWIGSSNSGLARYNAGTFRVYGREDGLAPTEVLSLAEDRWGSIWIGARRGLLMLPGDAAGGGGGIRALSRGTTFSLLRDHEGTIWAGTHTGLDQYKDWRLRVYGDEQGLPDRNISSTFAARGGGLWVGTNGGGLAFFRDGKTVTTYGIADGLRSNDVTSVCESRDGTVWFGSWGEGLYRLRNKKISPVDLGDRLRSGIVRSIYEDHAGDIWVGTWGDGLLQFHGDSVTSYTRRDGLVDDQVRVIEEDPAGNLWIATHGGLSKLGNGHFKNYTLADGLSENSIFALRADAEGSLWIGTWGGGLNRIKEGRVTSYTTRDGLPCDTICEILEDGRGNLWMSSVKGIIRIRKVDFDAHDRQPAQTISSSLYDRDDGMSSAQCNRGTQPSGCRTANGCLWFATIDGIVMVDPASLPTNHVVPTAILEQVLSDRSSIAVRKPLELRAARREIEIRYTAPCLLATEKVRFRYKLEGYNGDWIEAGHRREVQYSNLPPGFFKFIVSACNSDGVWGPATELLHLAIVPPFFLTLEFRAVCGILALGAAGASYRLWMARLRARERELVVLVDRRTAEARAAQAAAEGANNAKNRFLAVLSHELRTPLTPVLLSVDCLLNDEPVPEAREQLEMIRRNVELEARLVDDLLDVSRIECDRLKLELELVDVHQAIARATEVCSEDIKKSGLKILLQLHAQSHYSRADQARLIQVFWNLIRNAAKFATPNGSLSISTREEKSDGINGNLRLVIEFQDTGIGIDPDMLEKIFDPFEQGSVDLRDRRGGLGLGLAISRAVAQAHGGTLTAASPGRNQGSVFRLELPALAAPSAADGETPRPALIRERPTDLKVLLVEDNADTLRYLCVVLKRQGHQVTPASTLALARQAANEAMFDLLISDIELPDGSGLELIRELKPLGILGIALSGYGSEEDIRNSLAAGFAQHLVKPLLAEVLNDAICRLANRFGDRPQTSLPDYINHVNRNAANDESDRLSPLSAEPR
jgi:ligand-binding sensor domain-containing protein/signal transduction histidine kinase/DNA-binding NarL/FixJ family response regulator